MAQVAERDAQMEHDLIDNYDEYDLGFSARPEPRPRPTRRTPPVHHAATSRRRSRGR
jgi:hypothetical protein